MTYFFNINLFKGAYFYNRVALQHNFTHIKNKKKDAQHSVEHPILPRFASKNLLAENLN